MTDKLLLELVSPERLLLTEEVDEIVAPGILGDVGILPGHAPMLIALRVGEISYNKAEVTDYIALENGFLEVSNDKVVILSSDMQFETITFEKTKEFLQISKEILQKIRFTLETKI